MYLNLKWEIFNYLFKEFIYLEKIKVPVKFSVNIDLKLQSTLRAIIIQQESLIVMFLSYLYACHFGNDKQQTTINIII